MTSTTLTYPFLRAAWRRSGIVRGILIVFFIAMLTVLVLALASWELFTFLIGCAIFFTALCLVRPLSGRALAGEREAVLLSYLVIWVFFMVSEAIFSHSQTTANAAKGHVDPSAVYQALSWILSFAALVFITCFRPAYLRRLFAGPLKWASIFAIIAVLSCPISSKPMYSAALAFKLCVIVLTLCAIGEAIEDETGILKLFASLFLGSLIIVSKQFVEPFLGPGQVFKDGRMPMIGLSGTCGILLLSCLLLFFIKKNLWFLMCAAYSVAVMML